MSDGVSVEPVIAPLPTPISVEPRAAAPAEAAEVARQAEEAKVAAGASKSETALKVESKEKDESKKPLSTREALRAARERVEAEPAAEKASPLKADPKAAEPAAKEPAKAADTKAADTKAAEPAVARGEDGKFVSAKPAEPAKAVEPAAKAPDAVAKAAEPAKALPSHTAEPPPARFSAAAKERWAEAPDEVRAEVTRAVTELTKGFEKHRAAAERDSGLAEFHDMAAKGQKNLRDVVANYVGMENLLRSDPIKGFELICQNAGLSFRDMATKYLNQAPDAAASQADATILELRRELADLKQGLGAIQQERTQAKTDSTTEAVTKFAADHPRFEELSEDIAFFLKTRCPGDLAEAYKLAERLNPAPVASSSPAPVAAAASSAPAEPAKPTLVVTPAASAAVDDRGQKSIAGAPSAGSDPVRKQPSSSIKEALRRAAARAG